MNEMLPLLGYCALMSSTPGPNNMMLVASGAQHGYRRTLPAILGMCSGVATLTLAACLGLGALFVAWPALHTVLKLIGTLYMLVLAWRLVGGAVAQGGAPQELGFVRAAAFQLVNPKSWVRAVTVASVFMPAQFGLVAGASLVSGLGAVVGFPCLSMWALFGTGIRRYLSSPARQRRFNIVMAASLLVLALMLLR